MTSTTNAPNGRVSRKTLADQIDRLDGILDGLSDGLNDAVVTAVREAVGVAVREAVRGVLTEIVSNPELLETLRGPIAPPTPAPPASTPSAAPTTSAEYRGARMRAWVGKGMRAAGRLAGAALHCACAGVAWVCVCVELLRPYGRPLLLAAGVGVLVGALAYVAGPWLSALAGGVGGFATTLAVQVGVWLRRTLGAFPHPGT